MKQKIKGIISIIILIALLITLTGCNSSTIANEKLTKENYEQITKQYVEENKESDDVVYFTYAITNYSLKDGLAVTVNTELSKEQKETETYKNIYGKTINQLIQDGKTLMKENNMTVEKFKETMQNLSNNLSGIN